MKNNVLRLSFLLFSISCMACSQQDADQGKNSGSLLEITASDSQSEPMPSRAEESSQPASDDESGSSPATAPSHIIRTAEVQMEVRSLAKTTAALRQQLAALKADISHETEEKSSYRHQVSLVLRVPPARFDTLIALITAHAQHLDRKDISARDVTRQYIDLETRLESKRAVVKRYREILQSAKTVQDVLSVEEHLRTVVEEIESTEGELRYLRDQVQYSTIHLSLYEAADGPQPSRRSFWDRLGDAMAGGWSSFLAVLVALIGLWPFWLVLAGAAIWWTRRRRK